MGKDKHSWKWSIVLKVFWFQAEAVTRANKVNLKIDYVMYVRVFFHVSFCILGDSWSGMISNIVFVVVVVVVFTYLHILSHFPSRNPQM